MHFYHLGQTPDLEAVGQGSLIFLIIGTIALFFIIGEFAEPEGNAKSAEQEEEKF